MRNNRAISSSLSCDLLLIRIPLLDSSSFCRASFEFRCAFKKA